jgi:hypothetical protein
MSDEGWVMSENKNFVFYEKPENAPSACGGDESVLINWVSKGA